MNAGDLHARSSLPLRALAACALCSAIAVTVVSPRQMGELPSGFRTPIMAFELARTPAEIERMFGPAGSPERETYRARMRLGVLLDYALLLTYGLLLAGVAQPLAARWPRRARIAAALALAAAAFDAFENYELLRILAALGSEYDALLRLALFTWPKWFALGAYFAVLWPALRDAGGVWRSAALAGVVSVAAAVPALFVRGVFAEVMGFAVAAAIALLVVATLRSAR